jgi:hypothetical protein
MDLFVKLTLVHLVKIFPLFWGKKNYSIQRPQQPAAGLCPDANESLHFILFPSRIFQYHLPMHTYSSKVISSYPISRPKL